jgi:hypothetical protein
MNSATLLKLGCAAVALTIGLMAGSYHSDSSKSYDKSTARHTEAAAPAARGSVPAPVPAFKDLDSTPRTISDSEFEVLKAAKGARRWLLLLSFAEKATAADMAALIYSVGPDSTAIRMLAARWAELDPIHMLASIYGDSVLPEDSPNAFPYRSQLGIVLFEEWAKRDLATAVKALTDLPDSSARESYRSILVRAAMKEDVEQGLRLMKEWHIRASVPDMKKVTEWAARDPLHAAKAVVEFGGDYSTQQVLRAIGTVWAQTDPEGGLRYAANVDPAARAILGNELVRKWAERDPAAAAAFAASQNDMAYRSALGRGLVSTWAVTDPTKALAWSRNHLRGEARTEAVAAVIQTYAESDLTAASQLVADMEPGGMQNRACASIFEAWFNKGPSERNAAFEWLSSLPNQEAQQMALSRVQWNRAFNDPDSLSTFLSGPYAELAPDYVVTQFAGFRAANDPEGAMKWASSLPAARGSAARLGVLGNWMAQRPEQAQAYVLAMPSGSERQDAVRTVSLNIGSQSTERAVEWYRNLPAADQAIAMQAFQQLGWKDHQYKALEKTLKE